MGVKTAVAVGAASVAVGLVTRVLVRDKNQRPALLHSDADDHDVRSDRSPEGS